MSKRLISLDILRGLTIIGMIIVNNPGSWGHVYEPLLHADWHGLTFTDIIFPFFLFIVGVSICFAYGSRVEAGVEKAPLYRKIVIRSLKILALGWFLALWPSFNFSNIRLVGVLPRIAVVFCICSFLFLNTNWRQQVYWTLGILVSYFLVLHFIPVPIDDVIQLALETGKVKSASGEMEVSGLVKLSDQFIAANYEPATNLAGYLDRLFVPGRMWQKTWDPEGFLSTIPALGSTLMGILAGQIIRKNKEPFSRIAYLMIFGFMAYIVGGVLGWFMPYNKNLWTSSFVLFNAGMASMGLGACMYFIDFLDYSKGTKMSLAFGSNAITAFVLAGLVAPLFYKPLFGGSSLKSILMEQLQAVGLEAKLASLSIALLYLALIYIPIYILYKRKIFIKV